MKESFAKLIFTLLFSMLLMGCTTNKKIANGLKERDANEIIVVLDRDNIKATKVPSSIERNENTLNTLWDIEVPEDKAIEAMHYLNQNGLPKSSAQSLLEYITRSLNLEQTTISNGQIHQRDLLEKENEASPELINIWSIELAKTSSFRFHLLLFTLLFSNLIFIFLLILFSWKIYPLLRGKPWSQVLNIRQIKLDANREKKHHL